MAIIQAVCFVLSNAQFHPLAKILEDCDGSDEGNYFLKFKVPKVVYGGNSSQTVILTYSRQNFFCFLIAFGLMYFVKTNYFQVK